MNIKAFCLGLSLALFSCFLPLSYIHAAVGMTPSQGIVGTVVTVSELTAGQSYVVQWDGVNYSSGTSPSNGIITFTVPETVGGSHSIVVQCPPGTPVFSSSFIVIPSITISPDSGTVGTTVSVSGKGFAATEQSIVITYDGNSVKTGITADNNGSWTTTFIVPASPTGTHTVDASGAVTNATSVEDKTFSIKPAIRIEPLSGGVGAEVTIRGSGFVASESGISVTYDNKVVKSGIVADSNGSWSTNFNIPKSSGGNHVVDASGNTTTSTDVPDISFAVASGISIDKGSAYVGDTINITGTGFGQYESGILVTFDGIAKASNIIADDSGVWSVSMTIPACVNGVHTINAHGSMTAATSVLNRTITVSAKIALSPTGGNVGDVINVIGTGFSGGKNVTVTYGDVAIPVNVTTDSVGNFSGNFKAPGGKSGKIKVVATDAVGISASSIFEMETIPPPLPRVTSPGNGNTVGFIGGAKVTFKWTNITDPSGVYYDLQVSSQSDFAVTVIKHTGLTVSEYKSTDAEALPRGKYYWRVRAVDGAGNASEWTAPSQLKAGVMTVTTFIIILVFGLLIILIAIRARMVFSRPEY